MTNRFRVAGTLARRLEELGVPPVAVLRRAGLPMGLFDQSKILVTTDEMFSLYSAIHEVSGDPTIGLKLGSEERIERYNPTAIAALYSRSFRDALERIARYKRLTCPEEIRIREDRKECAVEFAWLLAEQAEPPTLIDICFAWVVTIGRRGIGPSINPLRVELRRPEANRRIYEDHFRCPMKFGARHNKLLFRSEDIAQPFLTHNPDLLELVAPQLEAELTQQLADTRPSVVYCEDDRHAKELAAGLKHDVGFDPVDAGPLRIARYSEPFALLVAQLAYEGRGGPELA
jgi:Arabinose-binding domain of AraC transcription regulator, N-term